MCYLLELGFVFLLIIFIYAVASNPDTLFTSLLHLKSIEKLTFVTSLLTNHKYLGIGTALFVVFLSAASFAPARFSLLYKKVLSFMTETKPPMLNRRWHPGQSRLARLSAESRLAYRNGGEIGGLSNEGNTCFMNSVLQSMASSHSLLNFFNDNIYEDTSIYANGDVTKVRTGLLNSHMRFTAALKSLLDDLNGAYGSRGKEFSTRVLLKKMPDGPKQNFFMGYNQEDAQEFYQLVMRIVEKEYKKAHSSKNPSPEPEAPKYVPASEIPQHVSGCGSLGRLGTVYVPAHQVDPNIPNEENLLAPLELVTPVDGVTVERIGCITCGETGGIRYSVNSGLSLNLPYDRSYGTHYELLQLLDEWKKPELIDDVNCNRCGLMQTKEFLQENIESSSNETLIANFEKRAEEIDLELAKDYIPDEVFEKLTTKQMTRKTTKSKQILMSRPPPLLCIHINRSVIDPNTFMILKNSKSVSFPAVLDLNNYVADPDSINMDARFPLSKRDQFRSEMSESAEDESLATSDYEEMNEKAYMKESEQNGSSEMDVVEKSEEQETPEMDIIKDSEEEESSEQDSTKDLMKDFELEDSPEKVDFADFAPADNAELKYQLKAVISHMGTHNYGHYICYRRLRGTWWKANDEAVFPTTEDELLSSPGTFMLFYEMKDANDKYPDTVAMNGVDEKVAMPSSSLETPLSPSLLSLDEDVDGNENEIENDENDGDRRSVGYSMEEARGESEDELRELFPHVDFNLGEERAYLV